MMRFCWFILVVCCLLIGTVAHAFSALVDVGADPGSAYNAHSTSMGYRQLNQSVIGGEGSWGYLTCDSDARRLYIARETRVQVVDLQQGKVVGEVANTPGVQGIALVPKLHHGFTSNGKDNSVTVFNMKDLTEVQRITVGTGPEAIVFDPETRRVFTMNAGSHDITAIDTAKAKVVGTLPLGGRPASAVVDEQGLLFVTIADTNEIVAIDAAKLTILHRWTLAAGEHPTGLAIDPRHHRLFSVCSNAKMIVLDSNDGRVVETLPIGNGAETAVFDPQTGFVFSSNGRDGTMTVIHEDAPDTLNVTDTVTTQPGARTMALDMKSHRLYLATARFTTPTTGSGQPPTMEPNSFMILAFGTPPSPHQQDSHGRGGRGGMGRRRGGF